MKALILVCALFAAVACAHKPGPSADHQAPDQKRSVAQYGSNGECVAKVHELRKQKNANEAEISQWTVDSRNIHPSHHWEMREHYVKVKALLETKLRVDSELPALQSECGGSTGY